MIVLVCKSTVFFPRKHVSVHFLDNYNVLWAAGGTKRFRIKARND